MSNTKYSGVTHNPRNKNKPWRAQLSMSGKCKCIGDYHTDEQAAEAYDNLVHYAVLAGKVKPRPLNFPNLYSAELTKDATARTLEILVCCGAPIQGMLPPVKGEWVDSLRGHVDREILRYQALTNALTVTQAGLTSAVSGMQLLGELKWGGNEMPICPECDEACTMVDEFYSNCCNAEIQK